MRLSKVTLADSSFVAIAAQSFGREVKLTADVQHHAALHKAALFQSAFKEAPMEPDVGLRHALCQVLSISGSVIHSTEVVDLVSDVEGSPEAVDAGLTDESCQERADSSIGSCQHSQRESTTISRPQFTQPTRVPDGWVIKQSKRKPGRWYASHGVCGQLWDEDCWDENLGRCVLYLHPKPTFVPEGWQIINSKKHEGRWYGRLTADSGCEPVWDQDLHKLPGDKWRTRGVARACLKQ